MNKDGVQETVIGNGRVWADSGGAAKILSIFIVITDENFTLNLLQNYTLFEQIKLFNL